MLKDFNYRCHVTLKYVLPRDHIISKVTRINVVFLRHIFLKYTKLGSRNYFLYQVYCKNY